MADLRTPTPAICWGKIWYEYQGQGCSEGFHFLPPAPVSGQTSIEVLAGILQTGCSYRASCLPQGVVMIDAAVGNVGTPPDSTDALTGYLYGLHSGPYTTGTYMFGRPNDGHNSLSYRLTSTLGYAASSWLRFLDDADVVDNFFQQYGNVKFITPTPPFAVTMPTMASTKTDSLAAWFNWLLFYTVMAVPNPIFHQPSPPGGTLPYLTDTWRRLTLGVIKSKKLGAVRKAEKGKKAAYT